MTDNQFTHKIVVLEPDAILRERLQSELGAHGYSLSAHAQSQEALDSIHAMGSGIVIADYHAPRISGLELCAMIRELSELQALGFIYSILLTADPDHKLVVSGLESGADEVMLKPYHSEELFARLRTGARILHLHEEVTHRQVEIHKANAELAILNRRLAKLAHTDSLTGLANRRGVLERLSDQWALAERLNHPLSVVMIDVDFFKRVNDNYGHKFGDQVLCAIADTIRRSTRRYDICGRFGGEEFIVVCPETGALEAARIAERVRSEVSALRIEWNDQEIAPSISAGIAVRVMETCSADELISAADRQLYAAKQDGRNRVWVCDENGARRHVSADPLAVR